MTSSQLREEKSRRADVAAGGGAGADHRHQRHDARASAGEQQRPALRRLPDEPAADGAAELDPVARPELVRQVGRDHAVPQTLDGQLDAGAVGHRCDRVAALRLIAVLGGEADVDVLPRPMSGPAGHVEGDRPDARRLGDDVDDLRDPPVHQSPQYRCSRHGSP
jgi:hypothetical protein